MLWLLAIWAARLSFYITARNIGKGEDQRYQAIRARNQPALRAARACTSCSGCRRCSPGSSRCRCSAPSPATRRSACSTTLGIALWLVGFVFEAGGDWQLARFKRDPANAGDVMNRGLWRYTRHPNYFGEFCIWWGFWLIAAVRRRLVVAARAPALLTFLLLRVSGVTLLEKDIGNRRPQYADYVLKTNAFFPGPPRK